MLSEIAAHCDPSSRGEPGAKRIAHRSSHHGDANMQNRTAKFVSAIFASLLAGMPLTTVSQSAVPAADDCLSKPKGQAPEGSHWYYHIDRVSKRHCWYLGDQRERLSRAKPQNTAPIADPASPQKETATQRPVTDAYAELPCHRRGSSSSQTPPLGNGLREQPRTRRALRMAKLRMQRTRRRSCRSSLRAGPTRRA